MLKEEQMENLTITDKIESLSIKKFIALSVFSFGLYQVWWMYKSWRFFRDKDNLDIMPAARAIFSIFFLYSLFEKIQDFSGSKDYTKTFLSFGYFLGYISLNLISNLSDPYWFVSFFSFLILIPALESFNFGIKHHTACKLIENDDFNNRQVGILIVGGILWLLILMEMSQ